MALTKQESRLMTTAAIMLFGIILFRAVQGGKKDKGPAVSSGQAFGGYAGGNTPRSIFNNNPLNVALSSSNWKGKIPNALNTDKNLGINPPLEQFTEPKFGWRAGVKNFNSLIKAGYNTIDTLIPKWAGSSNPNYVAAVKNSVQLGGYNPNAPLASIEDFINNTGTIWPAQNGWSIYRAMAIFEAGPEWADTIDSQYNDYLAGYNMIKNEYNV